MRKLVSGAKIVLAAMMTFSLPMAVQGAYAETTPASAQAVAVMDAPTAFEKVTNGELLLLDIRSPQEWKETGVASVAKKVSMHERGFLQKLDALIGGDKSKPIALICRTGNRSARMQYELTKRGYSNVIDVYEGMAGSRNGPGWIKRGLPIVH
jgi:rhodanese-related sulfurtransferase